ncbi:MAG: divalent-cation tolerance protein CutA [Candidatus Omnitrophica bacterium]|nr:divalent-cation tolerance protein CutA [Candidatus Omnitrophota bacterium]MCM8816008.1 divalent-cation tolerance protein CutA [Candidatus Omnitrophota bacterium]
MKKYFVVITTFPEKKTAEKVCKILIKEKLAACCQISDSISSFYWWKGKIEKSREWLCLFKTEKSALKKLKKRLKSLHPYEVPEIVCLEIKDIDNDYAQWINGVIKND